MQAMTQAKADTSARPRTVCECRTRDRYGALVGFPTRTALAIHCSFKGRERHDVADGGEQEKKRALFGLDFSSTDLGEKENDPPVMHASVRESCPEVLIVPKVNVAVVLFNATRNLSGLPSTRASTEVCGRMCGRYRYTLNANRR